MLVFSRPLISLIFPSSHFSLLADQKCFYIIVLKDPDFFSHRFHLYSVSTAFPWTVPSRATTTSQAAELVVLEQNFGSGFGLIYTWKTALVISSLKQLSSSPCPNQRSESVMQLIFWPFYLFALKTFSFHKANCQFMAKRHPFWQWKCFSYPGFQSSQSL